MPSTFRLSLLIAILLVGSQSPMVWADELVIGTESARVQPFQSITLQARLYGQVNENGQTQRVRLPIGPVSFRLLDNHQGWISRPFRFQGPEGEEFYEPSESNFWKTLLGVAQNRFLRQDSVVYTAPGKPGKYRVEAATEDQTAVLELTVELPQPNSEPLSERVSFPPEPRSGDPYWGLAAHYAPLVAQETWFDPKADYLARFDFDGDWRGDNNWESTPEGSSQAFVYYTAMETETHWFLVYNFFHPRDYSDNCIAGTCHENDSEGLILTILKDGSLRGRIQVMETLAHDNIYSYRLDPRVRKGVHQLDGEIALDPEGHPIVFIEAGGHGVFSASDIRSRFDPAQGSFLGTTGVTYIFGDSADRPGHPAARLVSYQLLSLRDQWWEKLGKAEADTVFDDFFRYRPAGGRPTVAVNPIPSAFRGRTEGVNKARPFWAWHDRRTRKKRILGDGQWTLDPAFSVSKNLTLPGPFSLSYVHNPFLRPVQDATGSPR